jgi:hypothetical protein
MVSPYHLPRLQEIVVPVATADSMVLHAVPKENKNKNIPWQSLLLILNIDTHGSIY